MKPQIKRVKKANKPGENFGMNEPSIRTSGTYITYKIGSAQQVLRFLEKAEKPVSEDEISFELKLKDFKNILYILLDEKLIEKDSEKDEHFFISNSGRLRLMQTILAHQREE